MASRQREPVSVRFRAVDADRDSWHGRLLAAACDNDCDTLESLVADEIAKRSHLPSNVKHTFRESGVVDTGAPPAAVDNVHDENGSTPLIQAIYNSTTTGPVHALLLAGADPNGTNKYGQPALSVAAGQGVPQFVRLLLDFGALVNRTSADGVGQTALHAAAWKTHARSQQIMQILLDAGADVNAIAKHKTRTDGRPPDDSDGQTPLGIAAMYGAVVPMTFLMSVGATLPKHTVLRIANTFTGGFVAGFRLESMDGLYAEILARGEPLDLEADVPGVDVSLQSVNAAARNLTPAPRAGAGAGARGLDAAVDVGVGPGSAPTNAFGSDTMQPESRQTQPESRADDATRGAAGTAGAGSGAGALGPGASGSGSGSGGGGDASGNLKRALNARVTLPSGDVLLVDTLQGPKLSGPLLVQSTFRRKATAIVSSALQLTDTYFDVAVMFELWCGPEIGWFVASLSILVLSSLVAFVLQWRDGKRWAAAAQVTQCAVLFDVAKVVRGGEQGRIEWDTTQPPPMLGYANVRRLKLVESLLEAAPQAVLQVYVAVLSGAFSLALGLSVALSVASLGVGMALSDRDSFADYTQLQHGARSSLNTASWRFATIGLFRLCEAGARVGVIALYAAAFGPVALLLTAAAVWLVSTCLWVCKSRTCEALLTDVSEGTNVIDDKHVGAMCSDVPRLSAHILLSIVAFPGFPWARPSWLNAAHAYGPSVFLYERIAENVAALVLTWAAVAAPLGRMPVSAVLSEPNTTAASGFCSTWSDTADDGALLQVDADAQAATQVDTLLAAVTGLVAAHALLAGVLLNKRVFGSADVAAALSDPGRPK